MKTDALPATLAIIEQALDSNDLAQAHALLDELLTHHPHLLAAHCLRGEAHLRARQYPAAQTMFEKVLHADPEQIAALQGLSIVHQAQGDADAAQEILHQALEIAPDDADLQALLPAQSSQVTGRMPYASRAAKARELLRQHKADQAIRLFKTELRAQPTRIDLDVALAEALWRAQRLKQLQQHCYELLARQPWLLKPTLLLAYTLLQQQAIGGEALWQRTVLQDPQQSMAHTLFDQMPSITASPDLPQEAMPHNDQQAPATDDALLYALLTDLPPDEPASEPTNQGPPDTVLHNPPPAETEPAPTFHTMMEEADATSTRQTLLLATARIGWAQDAPRALGAYQQLIRDGALLDDVIEDLREHADHVRNVQLQRTINQLLGDAYVRHHRLDEAQ